MSIDSADETWYVALDILMERYKIDFNTPIREARDKGDMSCQVWCEVPPEVILEYRRRLLKKGYSAGYSKDKDEETRRDGYWMSIAWGLGPTSVKRQMVVKKRKKRWDC